MSTDLNLDSIAYQAALRSLPVRNNFIDIQTQFNLLRAEVYASIAATASEVTSARDYFSALSNRVRDGNKTSFNSWIDGASVSATAVATNTGALYASAGRAIVNGVGCSFSAFTGTVTPISGGGKFRLDAVVVNSDNSVSMVEGFENATGHFYSPTIASSQQVIAYNRVYNYGSTPSPVDYRRNKDITVTNVRYAYEWKPMGEDDAALRAFQSGKGIDQILIDWNIGDIFSVDFKTLNTYAESNTYTIYSENLKIGSSIIKFKHHKTKDIRIEFGDTNVWHVNQDQVINTTSTVGYLLPANGNTYTKFSLINLYSDGTNVFVAQNPYYKVL